MVAVSSGPSFALLHTALGRGHYLRGPGCRRRPLTCLKQKGMVSTLTPTMLFTIFMISPQLEAAAAAAIARL